ncbi:MAG: amino acid permease [Bacteroidetes bacterium]|nr:amino acid permease [Bacteroidota bacterium]
MTFKKYSRSVATNMVIANMIGTGIFTSIGFQVMSPPIGIPDPFAIMFIWLIGGIFALCGATAYAEVATTFRESGGEYTFLSKIYHPIVGFASGWVSLIVGFSAAIAALALASGDYLMPIMNKIFGTNLPDFTPKLIATLLLLLVTLIQLGGVVTGGLFQNVITAIKLLFILVLIVTPFFFLSNATKSNVSFFPTESSWNTILSLPFAGSLVYVMFAYSGWNSSSYIAGNMENPKKNLPFSLVTGTAVVTIIYLLLTGVFMYVCTFEELKGKIAIGNIVISKVFNEQATLVFAGLFAVALISGINAMFIAGPRVAQRMGHDYRIFSFLKGQSTKGAPVNAILLQTCISVAIILLFDFRMILQYIELTLSLFCLLTVTGVFVIRARKLGDESTIKTWGYPFTPLLFIGVTLWMIFYFAHLEPMRLFWTLITILSSVVIYFLSPKNSE